MEIAFPIRSAALKKRVLREGLQVCLKDNVNAWELGSDGRYRRRKPRGKQAPYSAQQQLMETLGTDAAKENEQGK